MIVSKLLLNILLELTLNAFLTKNKFTLNAHYNPRYADDPLANKTHRVLPQFAQGLLRMPVEVCLRSHVEVGRIQHIVIDVLENG